MPRRLAGTFRSLLVPAVLVALVAAGCSDDSPEAGPSATVSPAGPVGGDAVSTSSSTSTTAGSTGPGAVAGITAPSVAPPSGATRVTVGKIELPLPNGWTLVRGKDGETIDGDKVKGADSACLSAPGTKKDGIPFDCTGVLVLTGTAFDNSAEGQRPFDPDVDYQWYPGTDVPACEPDFPLVRSKIVESSLAPIGDKRAAFRRLQVQCEKRPTVHEAVTWTLPVSHIAVVSLFQADVARSIWAGARLL